MGSSDDEKNSCSDERPQHQVTVPSFFMGKYPVTQAQWEAVASQTDMKVKIDLNPDPSYFKGKNHPVERVSWDEAVEFCQRLSRLTGGNYRLPSEAEWEYACRAGTTTRFYFGDEVNQLEDYAWHGENSRGTTHPVGQKKPNAWGLYDMHGNVWEWCEDDWHDSYEGAPTDGSAWIENGNCHRVTRGGSWFKHPEDCLSASRDYDHRRANHLNDYGFRVVRGGSCREYPEFSRSAARDFNDRGIFHDITIGFRVVWGGSWFNYPEICRSASRLCLTCRIFHDIAIGLRVLRGGSWFNHPEICRSATRSSFSRRGSRIGYIGFRVVCGGSRP